MYIYIYIYIYVRELEFRVPRLRSPVNSRRSPETLGDFCESKPILL